MSQSKNKIAHFYCCRNTLSRCFRPCAGQQCSARSSKQKYLFDIYSLSILYLFYIYKHREGARCAAATWAGSPATPSLAPWPTRDSASEIQLLLQLQLQLQQKLQLPHPLNHVKAATQKWEISASSSGTNQRKETSIRQLFLDLAISM